MGEPSFTWDYGTDFRFVPWDQLILWPKPLSRIVAQMNWPTLEFFCASEFDSPDEPGSGLIHMNHDFVMKLDQLRARIEVPLHINSGFRTAAWNKRVGGKQSSAHRKGFAVDIRVAQSGRRFTIVEAALAMGFKRVGIGKTFVHLDASLTLSQQVLWLY